MIPKQGICPICENWSDDLIQHPYDDCECCSENCYAEAQEDAFLDACERFDSRDLEYLFPSTHG